MPRQKLIIEYHGKQLEINGRKLESCAQFRVGAFFQFLGELERLEDKVCSAQTRTKIRSCHLTQPLFVIVAYVHSCSLF